MMYSRETIAAFTRSQEDVFQIPRASVKKEQIAAFRFCDRKIDLAYEFADHSLAMLFTYVGYSSELGDDLYEALFLDASLLAFVS